MKMTPLTFSEFHIGLARAEKETPRRHRFPALISPLAVLPCQVPYNSEKVCSQQYEALMGLLRAVLEEAWNTACGNPICFNGNGQKYSQGLRDRLIKEAQDWFFIKDANAQWSSKRFSYFSFTDVAEYLNLDVHAVRSALRHVMPSVKPGPRYARISTPKKVILQPEYIPEPKELIRVTPSVIDLPKLTPERKRVLDQLIATLLDLGE